MTPTNPVTLLRSVSAYVLHEKAQIQRLIIDQKYTFWCHKVEIKPLNFACFHKNTNILRFIIDQKHTFWCHKLKIKPLNFSLFAKKKLVTPTNPVTLLVSVSTYILEEKAKIQRLKIDQQHTFWCHKVKIKPLNYAFFHKNTKIQRFKTDQKHTYWCHKLKIKPLNFALFAKKFWWPPPIP